MVSIETDLTKNHELWKRSGLSPDDGINKIMLPKEASGYASRSSHSGRHTNDHHERLLKEMDKIRDTGIRQEWTTEQFKFRFQKMLITEREGLINGNIDLYMKNKKGK